MEKKLVVKKNLPIAQFKSFKILGGKKENYLIISRAEY